MPYIPKRDRRILASGRSQPASIGQVNYSITMLCLEYLQVCGGTGYQALNEIIGVLECAKMEMYRRMAAPYEDQKIAENGDVYPLGSS